MYRIITLFTLSGVLFLTAACGNGDDDYSQQEDLDIEQEAAGEIYTQAMTLIK